ncbi:hypothetical protein [Burkholderia ubonensis]|uniref:hypothetical protein n=1 Tax=Burkholderia ubonensis TaxID=101571 RepID=UPI001E307201|nr:hypothetical protein [Burkholderia ubonensis]
MQPRHRLRAFEQGRVGWRASPVFVIFATLAATGRVAASGRVRAGLQDNNSNIEEPVVPILLFCLLLFVSVSARAGGACDALLGDYAPAPDKPATLRVEKIGGEFALRVRDAGQWAAETEPAREDPPDPDGADGRPAGACVLMIPGGELIRMPVGAPYQVTSITGNGWTTKHSTTGVLLLSMQGFQVDGAELYPVARSGDSPASPAKAAAGR